MNERALRTAEWEPEAPRPRMPRLAIVAWIVGAVAILILGTLAFWTYYERSGRLSERVIAFANRHLADASNLRFSARRMVRTRLGVHLESPRLDVQQGGRWMTVLRADAADLRADLWSLLRGRAQNYEVHLTRPVFVLVYGPDGKAALPRFTGGGTKGAPRDGVRVFLDRATFEVQGPKATTTWWRKGHLEAEMLPQGNGYRIALERADGELPPLGLVVTDAHGKAGNVGDRLEVQELVARTDAGRLDLHGVWQRHELAFDFRARNWPWEFLGEILEQPALDVPGRVDLAGRISGTFERPVFATTAQGKWREEPFHARLDGRVAEEGLVLSRADLRWRQASLVGRAALRRTGTWFLEGTLAGLDLAEVDRLWPGVDLPPTRLGGPARLEGGGGRLRVAAAGLGGQVRGVPVADVRGTWDLGAGRHELVASGALAGGPVDLTARWDRHRIDLAARGKDLDLAHAAALDERARGLAGKLSSASLTLVGPLDSPHLAASASAAGVTYGAARAETLAARAEGTLGSAGHLALQARARELESGRWRADSAAAIGSFDRGTLSFPEITATHADTTLSLALEARPLRPGWRLQAYPARLTTPEWRLEAEAPLVVRSQSGMWHIEQARLGGDLGHLEIAGRFRNADDVDLTLSGRDLDLEIVGAALRAGGLSGMVTLDAHLTGDGGKRRLTGNLSSSGIVTARARYDSLEAAFALESHGNRLDIERLRLATRGGTLEGSGGARLSGREWPLSPADWLGALRQASEWHGNLSANRFDLSLLGGLWSDARGLTGTATATASLGGQPADPSGRTEGSITGFVYRGYRLDSARWRARYANGVVSLENLEASQDSVRSIASGTIPLDLSWNTPRDRRIPDRPMDVHVQVPNGSLAVLPAFLPLVAVAEGGMKADIHLTGTPRHPRATGTIQVTKGQVRFTGREEIYHDVDADLAFENEVVRIRSFRALQEDQGTLEGSGTATLGEGRVQRYDLTVRARNAVALASGEYAFRFDGDFRITAGPRVGDAFVPIPHVEGTVNVESGLLLYDFTDPANRVYFTGPRQAPSWVYDFEVHAPRNVYWRTPNANIELSADLTARQTLDALAVWGTVTSLRGDYYFLENKFRVESGTLTFDEVEPLNPVIDAKATASVAQPGGGSVRREDITIELSGRVRRPRVILTSSSVPPLSQTQIVQLLTYGRLGLKFTGSELTSGNQALLVGTTGGQYLVRQMARNIPEAAPILSGLEVGTTVVGEGASGRVLPTLSFGTYVSPDLRVRYSQVVGGSAISGQSVDVDIRDLGAEYRINKIFYLTGEVLERRNGSLLTPGAPQSEVQYNLDLRARYEF